MSGRIRSIKPEMLEDERVASLTDRSFRLFVSAILLADDHGNLRTSAAYLRGAIWWAKDDVSSADVDAALAELCAAELLIPYTVRGQAYAYIRSWKKHQRVDNAGKPRVPGPSEADGEICGESPKVSANLRGLPPDLRSPISDLRPTNTDRASTASAVTSRRASSGTRGVAPQPPAKLEQPLPSVSQADLDAVYQAFPRHRGRSAGMELARREIVTASDLADLKCAVNAFAAAMAQEERPDDKILYFSTFMGSWRDWLPSPEERAEEQEKLAHAKLRGDAARANEESGRSFQ